MDIIGSSNTESKYIYRLSYFPDVNLLTDFVFSFTSVPPLQVCLPSANQFPSFYS